VNFRYVARGFSDVFAGVSFTEFQEKGKIFLFKKLKFEKLADSGENSHNLASKAAL